MFVVPLLAVTCHRFSITNRSNGIGSEVRVPSFLAWVFLVQRSLAFARLCRGSVLGFACAGVMWSGLLRKSFGGSHTQTVTLSQGARVRDTIMSLVRPHEALTDRGLCRRLQRAMTIQSPDQFRNQDGTKRKLQIPRSSSVLLDGYAELMVPSSARTTIQAV